jgi:hypothetical protein
LVEAPLPEGVPRAAEIQIPLGKMVYCTMLCGMFIAHYSDDRNPVRNPSKVVSRYGVGVMLRGHEIKEALLHEDVANERRERDEQRASDAGEPVGPQPVSVRDEDDLTGTEFSDALLRATRITPPAEPAPEG